MLCCRSNLATRQRQAILAGNTLLATTLLADKKTSYAKVYQGTTIMMELIRREMYDLAQRAIETRKPYNFNHADPKTGQTCLTLAFAQEQWWLCMLMLQTHLCDDLFAECVVVVNEVPTMTPWILIHQQCNEAACHILTMAFSGIDPNKTALDDPNRETIRKLSDILVTGVANGEVVTERHYLMLTLCNLYPTFISNRMVNYLVKNRLTDSYSVLLKTRLPEAIYDLQLDGEQTKTYCLQDEKLMIRLIDHGLKSTVEMFEYALVHHQDELYPRLSVEHLDPVSRRRLIYLLAFHNVSEEQYRTELSIDPELMYTDQYGDSALTIGIRNRNYDIVSNLFQSLTKIPNTVNAHGDTPLIMILRDITHDWFPRMNMFRDILLFCNRVTKENVDQKDSHGDTALILFTKRYGLNRVPPRLFGEADFSIPDVDGKTPLIHMMKFPRMITTGLVPLVKPSVNHRDKDGNTALHHMVIHMSRHNIFSARIDQLVGTLEASINIQNNDGATPLMMAIKHRKYDVAVRLMSNPEIVFDHTYIQILFRQIVDYDEYPDNQQWIVNAMFDRGLLGTQLNRPDKHGCTPLQYACMAKRQVLARKLMGAIIGPINHINSENGKTALIISIENEWPGFSLELCDRSGTNLMATDRKGKSAIDYAKKHGMTRLYGKLLERIIGQLVVTDDDKPLAMMYDHFCTVEI